MKKLTLIITILLFTFLPIGAVKKFEANPINVAIVIVEKGDSASISKLFDYYGYAYKNTEDGYRIMKHSSGNEMRYSISDSCDGTTNTKVIVRTKATHKEVDNLLTELKFKKIGNLYERIIHRYNNQVTQCRFSPRNTLIFERLTAKNQNNM